jgi:hypothetical protein
MYSTNNVSTQQGGDGGMQENQIKRHGSENDNVLAQQRGDGAVQGKRTNQKMS